LSEKRSVRYSKGNEHMSKIVIRTRSGVYNAELDGSDLSNIIWLSLPFRTSINMLGSQIYFEMKTEVKVEGDSTVFDAGDIAYWPQADALCLFFGPTPLSGDDGRPVSAFPLKKIGRILDDFGTLSEAGDRQTITLERPF